METEGLGEEHDRQLKYLFRFTARSKKMVFCSNNIRQGEKRLVGIFEEILVLVRRRDFYFILFFSTYEVEFTSRGQIFPPSWGLKALLVRRLRTMKIDFRRFVFTGCFFPSRVFEARIRGKKQSRRSRRIIRNTKNEPKRRIVA